MSRSRKKNPGTGWAVADSDKSYKKAAHRRYRRAMRQKLWAGREPDPTDRLYFNPWDAPKDGKQWFGHMFGDHDHLRFQLKYNHRLGIITLTSESRHGIAIAMMRK